MTPKTRRGQVGLAALALLATAAVLTTATYAWFTFSVNTDVAPMQGSVGNGDVNLVIAASEGGEYSEKAAVTMLNACQELLPVSTADLQIWSAATAQTKEGVAVLYTDVTAQADAQVIHGEVYLKAEYADADLYLDRSRLTFTGSGQLLSALRLAMKITGADGEKTYFFKLDDVAGGGGAAQDTTGQGNSVVAAVAADGSASFAADPAEALAPYCAANTEGEDSIPEPGEKPLCRLTQDTPARVELWLYMEGCDENCLTEAATQDIGFNLAFAGVGTE